MVGTARKKVNLVAATRSTPRSSPPRMVAPEREVPGISASTWQSPLWNAFDNGKVSLSMKRGRGDSRSKIRMIAPPTNQVVAITGMAIAGLSKVELIHLLMATPTTAAGRNATMIESAKRRASGDDGRWIKACQKVRK